MTDRAAVALPRRALAGSAAGNAVEALTLAALVLVVPRALGPADYGGFAVALAVATAIATATGIGGPALFVRTLAPLHGARRRDVARTLAIRVGRTRAMLLCVLVVAAAGAALLAPGDLRALHVVLVGAAAMFGAAATLLSLAAVRERPGAALASAAVGATTFVWVALLAIPQAGARGAAAAMLAGVAATTAATFAALRRRP